MYRLVILHKSIISWGHVKNLHRQSRTAALFINLIWQHVLRLRQIIMSCQNAESCKWHSRYSSARSAVNIRRRLTCFNTRYCILQFTICSQHSAVKPIYFGVTVIHALPLQGHVDDLGVHAPTVKLANFNNLLYSYRLDGHLTLKSRVKPAQIMLLSNFYNLNTIRSSMFPTCSLNSKISCFVGVATTDKPAVQAARSHSHICAMSQLEKRHSLAL